MPSKNSIKTYTENGFYHVYNRGVEKRIIFQDELDYKMFLSYLKNYLLSPDVNQNQTRPQRKPHLHDKIQLISYCLMPNHFHLLIKQLSDKKAIIRFMRSLANAYTSYFNRRNERVGHLFQGKYKAVLISEEPYLLHLTRYIHTNPYDLSHTFRSDLIRYPYSSYADYLGKRKTDWLHPEEILGFFKTSQRTSFKDTLSYQSFVEDYTKDSKQVLQELTIE